MERSKYWDKRALLRLTESEQISKQGIKQITAIHKQAYSNVSSELNSIWKSYSKETGLDIADDVSSPTFAIVHQYSGKIPLYHFDMYRISPWDDLYSTGFFDYLEEGNVIFIEWSENVSSFLPSGMIKIDIKKIFS